MSGWTEDLSDQEESEASRTPELTKEELVQRVTEFGRQSNIEKQKWWKFCRAHASGDGQYSANDPSRHEVG